MTTSTTSKDKADPPVRDEKGHFLPGNPYWKLHAFAEGHPGYKPNAWTHQECAGIMRDYITECAADPENIKPLTKSGLLNRLGISWEAYSNYRAGEYGKTDKDKRAYVELFGCFEQLVEEQLETALMRSQGQVSGVIFRLTNQFSDRWRSERYVKQEVTETKEIKLVLPPGELANRLSGGAVIEHQPDKLVQITQSGDQDAETEV